MGASCHGSWRLQIAYGKDSISNRRVSKILRPMDRGSYITYCYLYAI